MTPLLERIRAAKRAESAMEERALPMRRAIELASAAPPAHQFAAALRRAGGMTVIAELAAPGSTRPAGAEAAAVADAARVLEDAGAAALSVITDASFLKGSPVHLREARASVRLPILRKDFIVDEYAVYRSRGMGADAILLMAALVEDRLLRTLVGVSRSLHMDTLVEVHGEEELARALAAGADLVAVNNRDLATRAVSLETSLRLGPLVPAATVRVATGAIETPDDVARLSAAGYDAVLVGERLARDGDPAATLRRLLGGAGA